MSRKIRKRLLAMLVFVATLFFFTFVIPVVVHMTVSAHDWYPMECCSGMDCSKVVTAIPVSKTVTLPGPSANATTMLGMEVTDERGQSVFVPANFPKRESRDNNMHVCIGKTWVGTGWSFRLICIFLPPAM